MKLMRTDIRRIAETTSWVLAGEHLLINFVMETCFRVCVSGGGGDNRCGEFDAAVWIHLHEYQYQCTTVDNESILGFQEEVRQGPERNM